MNLEFWLIGKQMNKVAILCRGKSLAGIEFLPDDIDLFILVNRFGDELKIDEIGSYLENKNIYQVLSRVPDEADGMIRHKFYSKYNIQKMIQPYTIHMKNPHDFSDGNNRFYIRSNSASATFPMTFAAPNKNAETMSR